MFKTKYGPNGEITRYKARLVVRGFSQKPGEDYSETFAPVAKFTTMRMLLALAAHSDLQLQQMDVKTAFLNGVITESVYMCQPEGYTIKGKENKVCKLNKGIYGLKQSGCKWYERLDECLTSLGFTKSESDPSLYTMRRSDGTYLILLVYVDDLPLASNSARLMITVKNLLAKQFEMSDLGEPTWILGVKIIRNKQTGTIQLNQSRYIIDILKRFKMEECHPCSTPLSVGVKLEKAPQPETLSLEQRQEVEKIPYKQAVGSLIYLTCLTRPDIAFPVHLVSQFLSAYGPEHWIQVKRIVRYIKGTIDYAITYKREAKPLTLLGYSDSDWAADPISRRSMGAYVFKMASAPVSWSCKKNQSICLSSTEAEYKAISSAAREAIWCRRCFAEIGQKQKEPTILYCNNMGAIALSNNPVYHARTKHIGVYHHFIRDTIAAGEIDLKYIKTENNQADILTKNLPAEAQIRHSRNLGLLGTEPREKMGSKGKGPEAEAANASYSS